MNRNPVAKLGSLVVVLVPLLALTFAGATAGCHSNPHGYQDTPPICRLTTAPAGAKVLIEDLNLELETPCDLPTEIDGDSEIAISKDGYLPYKGPLNGLREVSRANFFLELRPTK